MSLGQPPFSHKEALRWRNKAAQEGPQLFEWLGKKKNGKLFWVEVNLKCAEISGRQSLMAIVRDITDRKQAEKSLEIERAQLLAIFDSINEVGRQW
ncbi:MAG: PAS domain S-box protein [Bacillota bacterium]